MTFFRVVLIQIFSFLSFFLIGQLKIDSANYANDKMLEDKKMNDTSFQKKLFFNFGTGISNLDDKNLKSINFENELSFSFSKFFSSAVSVHFGKEFSGKYSLIEGNLNGFVTPFPNKKFSFKLGGGFSYASYNEFRNVNCYYVNGVLRGESYVLVTNSTFGINYILESTFSIKKSFTIGAKIFFQQYFNGFYNSGIIIKTGLKLY